MFFYDIFVGSCNLSAKLLLETTIPQHHKHRLLGCLRQRQQWCADCDSYYLTSASECLFVLLTQPFWFQQSFIVSGTAWPMHPWLTHSLTCRSFFREIDKALCHFLLFQLNPSIYKNPVFTYRSYCDRKTIYVDFSIEISVFRTPIPKIMISINTK